MRTIKRKKTTIDEEEITGYRLIYKSPVAIVDVPFDFELTEIELP